jgi:hypothetical protein
MIGTSLSHYRIVEKLGAGSMGEVYRADDTNLRRSVAIKLLPGEFIHDAERVARFQREAEVLAALNHPNIATLYGLEESDGRRYLVMQLVEGETLKRRLSQGALPLDEALQICRQIAQGLEAAHERGVVHRDLKPANIQITPEGNVKILDFGIARDVREPDSADQTRSATAAGGVTRPGLVLGSVAYMSPEQAKGKPVDRRADVWAFGCILFECLTGKRAFDAETDTEILASVLKEEPNWAILPEVIPWKVTDLVHRCLQKDPTERLHDIADARIEITEALGPTPVPRETSIRRPPRSWFLAAVGAALLVGAASATLVMRRLRPMPPQPVLRSLLRIEAGQWLDGRRWNTERPTRTAMAIARGGSFVVYSAIEESPGAQAKSRIYLRRLDQMNAAPVTGTEGGINPFLSPDDQWIGFWEGGKLKKVAISGGVPITLCDAAALFGADWGPDNSILFSPREGLGLLRVSSQGGTPEVLTVPDKAKEETSHRLPHFLPDSRGALFTVMGNAHDVQPRLALLDLETNKWRGVIDDAADGKWLRTGHLVFLRQGTLMAVAFDLTRLEVRGQPVPAIPNVMQALNITDARLNTAAGQYSVSDSGWLAYVPGGILPDRENSLVQVDLQGSVRQVADFKAPFFAPRVSPDGQRIAYQTLGRERQLWVYDLNRSTASRLTGDGRAMYVTWTPDGKHLVFGWFKSGQANLYWQPADGSAPMERLTASDNGQFPGSFTPDGATLAFAETHPETNNDILLLDLKSRRVTPFLNSSADEGWPEISPDGRWMAYVSDEAGRREVWVRPFPGPGGRWLISNDGGSEPVWSKDGSQLFYRQGAQVWVADVRSVGGFSAGKARLLFEQRGFAGGNPIRGWDSWPDGKGFVMAKLEDRRREQATEMVLVINWFEELRRLCPTGRD